MNIREFFIAVAVMVMVTLGIAFGIDRLDSSVCHVPTWLKLTDVNGKPVVMRSEYVDSVFTHADVDKHVDGTGVRARGTGILVADKVEDVIKALCIK